MMRIYDETCLALCEGQFLDISFERRNDVTVAEYMDMIGRKTAALVAASVQAGAIMGSDDPDVAEAYRTLGHHLGLAFQMADDVKGTFWASADSGKAEAGDVRKRKKTLPIVWAMQNAAEADVARLREIYGSEADGPMPPQQVDEVLAILERSGARDEAVRQARFHRDRALADIAALPIPDERRAELERLVESVIAT
jgi:geranylgeranyl diphosphate synthase type I